MRNSAIRVITILIAINFTSCKNKPSNSEKEKVVTNNKAIEMNTIFVGTYTKKEGHVDGQAEGIVALNQNIQTGAINSGRTVATVVNPSFVKVSPNGKFLFAVSELSSDDASSGYFYSFKILEKDSLQEISRIATESFAPAHIALDKAGNYAFVSNYVGGVVMVYSVAQDGRLKKQQRIDLENPVFLTLTQ